MYYALAYYPRILHDGFHEFRNKYEPYAKLLAEHIPVIYPVPEIIGRRNLENHINRVLSNWEPFMIHLSGYLLTWDNWLMLVVKKGNEDIIQFHNDLYTSILSPYLREDLPYIPHVALGLFSKEEYDPKNPTFQSTLDESKYQKAISEVEELRLDFWRKIDCLTLIKLNEDYTKCWDVEEFKLPVAN